MLWARMLDIPPSEMPYFWILVGWLVGSYDVYGSQESIVFLYFEWSIDNLRNSNLYFLSLWLQSTEGEYGPYLKGLIVDQICCMF